MTIEHRDIQESGLHEPKGVSLATANQVYVANGSGSGVWTNSLSNASNIKVDRVLDGLSLAASQEPTAVDTPIQIEFGAAQNTSEDPVMIDALGVLTFNEEGTYRLKVSLAVGRTGGAGVSELYARALVDGVQAGQSIHFKIGSSDEYLPYSDEAWLNIPAGTTVCYELLRDSTGNNSGGLFSGQPTLVGWNDNPNAAIRVERWSA
ncbi:MAG: hypothetical protein OQK00_05030 [Rhodobacteraceae bacterium]|nr:hypothetical protein [Paracoccaceae bacterium]